MLKHIYSIEYFDYLFEMHPLLRNVLKDCVKYKYLKKGAFLDIKPEKQMFFIMRKGIVRSFYKYKSKEVNTCIFYDGQMVSALNNNNSFFQEEFQCLEDCFFEYYHIDEMSVQLHSLIIDSKVILMMTDKYTQYIKDIKNITRLPLAKDRWAYLNQIIPDKYIKKTPSKHIASLLGIEPATLCRITIPSKSNV